MIENVFDIAVIGGGASGMAAALTARRHGPDLKIALLERQTRVGKKLLATGNGRCNLTNLKAAKLSNYHGGAYLGKTALSVYTPEEITFFFSRLGLETVSDEEGRVYPMSDQAASVVDVLRLSLDETGVQTLTGFEASVIKPGFIIRAADGREVRARRVIVCCGGPAGEKVGGTADGHKLLKSLGHDITRLYPALCQLKTDPEPVRPLKGIRFRGGIVLLEGSKQVQREEGEVLFCDYGLSGIAAMALCRKCAVGLAAGKAMTAVLQILPIGAASLEERRDRLGGRLLEDFLTGPLPKRLGQHLIKQAGIAPLSRPAQTLTPGELSALADILGGWKLRITGTQSLGAAQVTAGGADVRAFNPDTLESRLVPGLYAAGEVLDVDGDCGGFNLNWAWASGMLAGEWAAKSLS